MVASGCDDVRLWCYQVLATLKKLDSRGVRHGSLGEGRALGAGRGEWGSWEKGREKKGWLVGKEGREKEKGGEGGLMKGRHCPWEREQGNRDDS